jgi:hypothetical protein
LSEQLRRFLDDQVRFDNRRVIDLLRDIEARALALRDERPIDLVVELDASAPEVRLPMERPLYTPVRKPRIDSSPVRPADADDETDPVPCSSRSTSIRTCCAATSAPRSAGARRSGSRT